MLGHIVSEETKKKLSNSNKNKIKSEEHKLKIGLGNTGKKCSKEKKLKLSERAKLSWKKRKLHDM